jgi:hypothetical protein
MPQLCGCFHSSEPESPKTQVPACPDAGFVHRVNSQSQPPRYDPVDNGYTPVVPLPRYTPRPVSIHEKSIGSNFHEQQQHRQPDEKNPQDFEELDAPVQAHSTGASSSSNATVTATMDDASSAYSFPSSFGHTSTDTRDTPPPPYSSCGGSLYSRSRASSLRSSHHRRSDSLSNNYPLPNSQQQTGPSSDFGTIIAPPPMAHIGNSPLSMTYAAAPINSRQAGSRPTQNQRRMSWESR